jgi:hypothetical protein
VDIGAQDKKKLMAAVGLGALALVLVAYELLSGPSSPAAATAPANAPLLRPTAKKTMKHGKAPAEPRLDPTLDLTLLAATEQTKYSGNGRNIFVAGAEPITPLGNGTTDHKKKEEAQVFTQPVLPPPPPITLKFFGFASKPGEPKRIFLSQGEDVFIAAEGDIVNRRYKVLHISPTAVDIEDVLYNNRQSIPLTLG